MLLNLLSADFFVRVDLTREGVFTLSEASRSTMGDLEDQVTITAYFSGGLPPTFEAQKRQVRDLLEEYRSAARGLLSFQFVDPQEQESEEDRELKKETRRDIFGRRIREQTTVERELEQLGIRPVEIRVIEDDSAQTRLGYLGILVRYQEEQEVIPVIQDVDALEYDLTTIIRRLTTPRLPTLGVLQGKGEASLDEDLSQLVQRLRQNYDVVGVRLSEEHEIDDEVDALLVPGNTEPYDPGDLRVIDQFLMQGRSVAFLLDLVSVDMSTLQATPVDHGFGGLLSSYGVRVGTQLVADSECATITIAERRGLFNVQMPVLYPFIPQPRHLAGDSPLTRGISNLPMPFVLPVFPTELEGVDVASVVRSSDKSWLEPVEAWRFDPRRDWRREDIQVSGPYDLVLRASGILPSHFAAPGAAGQTTEDGLLSQSLDEARVVVAGTSRVARDGIINANSGGLLLNVVDWMLLDPALLEMRSRGRSEGPLDDSLSETSRAAVKYGNVVGIPILLGFYGLVRRMRREARRGALARRGATP